jgi:hypothetical protein
MARLTLKPLPIKSRLPVGTILGRMYDSSNLLVKIRMRTDERIVWITL